MKHGAVRCYITKEDIGPECCLFLPFLSSTNMLAVVVFCVSLREALGPP